MTDATLDPLSSDPIQGDRTNMRRRALIAFAILIAVTLAAVTGILVYADQERERLYQDWTIRLGIVADSRKAAVEGWLNQRRAEMLRLAGNRALQFYLVDRADPEVPAEAVDSRLPYIEELMTGDAIRGGYTSVDALEGQGPDQARRGGLLLFDGDRKAIAGTPGAPRLPDELKAQLSPALAVSRALDAGDGTPMVAISVPVMAPNGGLDKPLGYLVGFRSLDAGFFGLLRQPGDVVGDSATAILQAEGETIQYVSPDAGGTYFASGADDVARALSGRSGGSGVFTSSEGLEVLAVSRAVEGVAWTLVRSVHRNAALADGERRIWLISGVLMLTVLLAGVCVVAVWRHAISDRLASAASDLSQALRESDRLSRLLQRLTDAVPNGIIAVGPSETVLFGNRAAFKASGIDAREAEGKDLVGIFGPGRAGPLLTANAKARESGESQRELDDQTGPGGRSVVLRSHVPLDGDGVLMVTEDMTEIVVEREARTAQLDSLVDVLVDLIDARDTYAAHHSRRVAELSRQMAEGMKLDEQEVRAAETAARLMNLGKLSIEPSLLTKTGDLSPEELALVRGSIMRSADLVAGVNFDGPVVESLRQLQERLDGSGRPAGISGDDFLVTAQIVSLANAYVALISDRAHRSALSVAQAHEQLWSQAGEVWGRNVVAALVQATDA